MAYDEQATVVGSKRPSATLVVRQGTQAGVTFPLTSDQVIIGREEGVDIVIQDAEVSRHHCQISWQANAFIVHDLGSTNGVFVNGVEITAPRPLQDGDTIRLGQTTLLFQSSVPAAPVETREPAAEVVREVQAAPERDMRRWLYIGCGCLILLVLCVAATAGVLVATGQLDLGF